jgi:8-oxo-dGTP diphosphatase
MKEFGERVEGVEYSKRPGCYGVIIKDGRIGVLKPESYNTYFLTGGGIEEGENECDALRREAAEEIGYKIEIGEKIGEAQEYFYSKSEQRHVVKECRFYRVSLLNDTKKESKYKLVWIEQGELKNMHHQCYQWIAEKELGLLIEDNLSHK